MDKVPDILDMNEEEREENIVTVAGSSMGNSGPSVLWQGVAPKFGPCYGMVDCTTEEYTIGSGKIEIKTTMSTCGLCPTITTKAVKATDVDQVDTRQAS